MGRLEKHLDPEAGPLAQLAFDLRELRRKAGSPTYREMSRVADYSPSALSAAASGASLPSPAVLAAYVRACDGDADEWLLRRTDVAVALAAPPVPIRPAGPAGGCHSSPAGVNGSTTSRTTPPEREPRRRRRFSRHIAGLAAAAVLGSMATVLPMAIWGAPSCMTSDHGHPSTAVSCPRNPEAR